MRVLQFWSSGESRLTVLLTLEMMHSYCLFTEQDKIKLRNWVQDAGDHSDTEVLLTVSLLFREERACKKICYFNFSKLNRLWHLLMLESILKYSF